MQTISILSDEVINQIAAGEVIENPASVIKELMENSLDAQAKNIRVEIKNGGLQLIKIEDDGCGMREEDAKLSIARHATSKIKSFDDLQNLTTMGFRGEALSSIAAISKMEIKTAKDEQATCLKIEGGKLLSLEKCARTRGTTIDIRSLFYNVPVRKTFQKSEGAIAKDIQRLLINMALARPDVGLTFIANEKVVFQLESQQDSWSKMLKERIETLFGKDFFLKLIPIYLQEVDLSILGFIASPSFVKKNKSSQYLFMNNRAVFSYQICKFIKDGYGTAIQADDFPVFVLHFFMQARDVDVNVHPQKKEIRLKDEQMVRQKILKAIGNAFQPQDIDNNAPLIADEVEFNQSKTFTFSADDNFKSFKTVQDLPKQLLLDTPQENYFQQALLLDNYFIVLAKEVPLKLQKDGSDGFVLFNLSAIHARVVFEELKGFQTVKKQQLILPIIFDLELDDMVLLEKHLGLFFELGLEIRILAVRTIALDAIPSFIEEKEALFLIQAIVQDLHNMQTSTVLSDQVKKKLAQNICRFAKSKKRIYTKEIAVKMIEKLLECEEPYFDPLGKKTILDLDCYELDKIFK